MKGFILKNKLVLSISVFVALSIGIASYLKLSDREEFPDNIITVSRGDIIQEVLVSGRVRAAQSVDLGFLESGRIRNIAVSIGERVYAGELLSSLENGSAYASLQQAEADLKAEEAVFLNMQKGAKHEELAVLEAKVELASLSLEDARQNLLDKIKDAYTKGDDAARNKSYQFFSNPRSSNPIFNLSSSQTEAVDNLELEIREIEITLVAWNILILNISALSDLKLAVESTRANLNQLARFSDNLAFVINALEPGSLTSTVIDGYKSDVSTSRTNINTALSNLSLASEKLRSAESSLLVAKRDLDLEKAGSSTEELAAELAKVEKYKANLKKYQSDYLRTVITAPFSGVITAHDGNIGEIIGSNETVLSMISDAKFEIEANVAEADIINLERGDEARVYLDAYGKGDVFYAKVVSISQSEKIIEGVPTYKTILQFKDNNSKIKSGMSADMEIATDKREDVISIPQRALIFEGEKKYVRKVSGDSYEKVEVETGLLGSLGDIEIKNGLIEGDKIIVFLKES